MSAWGGILFVRSRHCGELNRGLQNLDSLFGKVLILLVRSRDCGELKRGLENLEKFRKDLILLVGSCCLGVLIRGLQNLDILCKGTACHFLRRAKSDQKARGTPSCDLRFKSPLDT